MEFTNLLLKEDMERHNGQESEVRGHGAEVISLEEKGRGISYGYCSVQEDHTEQWS